MVQSWHTDLVKYEKIDKVVTWKHEKVCMTATVAAMLPEIMLWFWTGSRFFRKLWFARDMKRLFNESYVLNVNGNVILK